jgi:hypothetical protein
VTAIEAIYANSYSVPLCVIFAGKVYIAG